MIRTRFPPEPNGYLHLGHVKAMLFDFEYNPGCDCTLRLDDTNPEAEKQEYVDAILEDVAWMGYTPSRVTYTSDYFGILYEYAETLVTKGLAYVDFSSPETIKEGRLNGTETAWRNTSVEENLVEFRKMKDGAYPDGHCVLRLKITMTHTNPNMRDPIAYRIKHTPHYRTGDAWKIYPSYDYSHGIVDALETITYSYCTSEFYIRRPLYLWPLDILGLVPAEVKEFGRLNVEGVTLSKRKMIPLVESGTLAGFDDPRIFTIRGLRRRGFTPTILKTIAGLSSIELKDTLLSTSIVLHHLRTSLDERAERKFAVLDPIRVTISNHYSIYIDTADFREVDSPDYYRLAPGKIVRLRYGPFIQCTGFDGDTIFAEEVTPPNPKKVKGCIHWLRTDESSEAIFELYDDTFQSLDKHTKHGFVHNSVADGIYQFERTGYFRFDRMEQSLTVFTRIVGLLNKFDSSK